MVYNGYTYLEDLLESPLYQSSWKQTFSFTYIAGASVYVTPAIVATIPQETTIKLYAGESSSNLSQIINGIENPVLFISNIPGANNLYFEIIMESTAKNITPIINSLDISIRQETSLYTAAVQVLSDSKINTLIDYNIDIALQNYKVPYLFLEPKTHREAMVQIGEACGGVTYQDRYGVIQVEAGGYLKRKSKTICDIIGENKIYDIRSPLADVKNKIILTSYPYAIQTTQTVWEKVSEPLNVGSNLFSVKYDNDLIVISGATSIVSSPSGASILSETHYSWGAEFIVTGTSVGQVGNITITGKPLAVTGTGIVEEYDSISTRNNGIKTLSIKDNKLIQSTTMAEILAENILSVYANPQRDISIDWRGDPSLELGDCVKIVDTEYNIIEQEFNFNGVLTSSVQLRRA